MSKKKKAVRAAFRNAVFERDRHACVTCGAGHTEAEPLDAHHITDRTLMPNGGYVASNGVSLCPSCHLMAEAYHISNHQDWHEGFHPNDLYKLINSSYDEAVRDSERLL